MFDCRRINTYWPAGLPCFLAIPRNRWKACKILVGVAKVPRMTKTFASKAQKKSDRYREWSAPLIFYLGCSTLIFICHMMSYKFIPRNGLFCSKWIRKQHSPSGFWNALFGPGRSDTLRCLQHLLWLGRSKSTGDFSFQHISYVCIYIFIMCLTMFRWIRGHAFHPQVTLSIYIYNYIYIYVHLWVLRETGVFILGHEYVVFLSPPFFISRVLPSQSIWSGVVLWLDTNVL